MNEIKYAFSMPKSNSEFVLLLDEAVRIGKDLNQQLKQVTELLEASCHAMEVVA